MLLRELECAYWPRGIGNFAALYQPRAADGENYSTAFERNKAIIRKQADEFDEQPGQFDKQGRIHNKRFHFALDHESNAYEWGDEFNQHRRQFDEWGDEFNQHPPVG